MEKVKVLYEDLVKIDETLNVFNNRKVDEFDNRHIVVLDDKDIAQAEVLLRKYKNLLLEKTVLC